MSSNGRTLDSGSSYRGSNPCTPVFSWKRTEIHFEILALSSSGRGRVVLSHQTGVRFPVALPILNPLKSAKLSRFEGFFVFSLNFQSLPITIIDHNIMLTVFGFTLQFTTLEKV